MHATDTTSCVMQITCHNIYTLELLYTLHLYLFVRELMFRTKKCILASYPEMHILLVIKLTYEEVNTIYFKYYISYLKKNYSDDN